MNKHTILGQSGAGSLIPEFLLEELGVDYDVEFPELVDLIDPGHKGYNPLGKIPILICPDGAKIFESVAIVTYITKEFPGLIPDSRDPEYLIYWQILALLSSTIYSAYHRQHHSHKYVDDKGIDSLRIKAKKEQAVVYNYLEGLLSPYLCGKKITAVDFYLYTLTRWDLNKTKLREGRPNLTAFLDKLRSRDSVDRVLSNQPKKIISYK